ncbi:P2X purinoceptor 3-like [Periophthalmus magnuspinnatus]|uniref:P2X purinoceptor 3-like n=1 Tax=Periophthalmus magnuspinnatus TaxID=409849 RepID=UPI002436BD3D|nr:P2X purinoceptor 3-like [Periophthalmus magnuspinnatus]
MVLWGCIIDFFTYESTRFVVVKNWSVGIINRIVQVAIIAYFVGYVFIHEKAYQTKDTGIESSVMTKIKGFGRHNGQIVDVADYVFPPEGTDVFCIMTSLHVTENQFQGRCPAPWPYTCKMDDECKKFYGFVSPKEDNGSPGFCEVEGWCPTENEPIQTEPMGDIRNFTIFIKNSINFPLFDVSRGNVLSTMTLEEIRKCTYHPEKSPFCPIFRVGDILRYAGQTVEELIQKGGHIGIKIEWKCNLDIDLDYCVPQYFFGRFDNKNAVSNGYNFRFAKYYKSDNGTEYRTLYKVFAIRFDVIVTGNAGKFNMVPTLINVVAALTCLGLSTVLCDIILLKFLKGAEQYKAKKFEEVSPAQTDESFTPIFQF